jgi:hypothetical protein
MENVQNWTVSLSLIQSEQQPPKKKQKTENTELNSWEVVILFHRIVHFLWKNKMKNQPNKNKRTTQSQLKQTKTNFFIWKFEFV